MSPDEIRTNEIRTDYIRIRPPSGWAAVNVRDLWAYRELLYFLTWRDVKVRYKQTVLGIIWAILRPFLTMVIFTVIFSLLLKVDSEGIPYPLFAFSALLPWTYFADALNRASNSLIEDQRLITRIYFPRLILPAAAVTSALLDLMLSLVVMLGMMLVYGVLPGLAILTLPFFIAIGVITALGVGLWMSALNIQYRDVRYTLPFIIQVWQYATPIIYPASLVPEKWRLLYSMNPMVGVIEGSRWALLGEGQPDWGILGVSTFFALLVLLGGMLYFRRMERIFADII